ncbi:efflux RND transporter permease subunit [Candidatus Riflebacteria bacterium]
MILSRFGVRWPVTTSMIFISFILLGLVAYSRVGLDLMPEMEIPTITITTSYKGAGPQEIEKRITKILEGHISTVPKIDRVTSISMEEMSVITVMFDWGVDLNEATNDIRDKIDLAKKLLPEDVDNPVLFKLNLSMIPVIMGGFTAEESWGKLKDVLEKKFLNPVRRIPGVALAATRGGLKRGILVQLFRDALKEKGLTGRQIVQILSSQNLNHPGGHVKSGNFDYLVRTPGELKNVRQIGQVVLKSRPGVVKLKDIASIKDAFLEKNSEILLNGKKAMFVFIQKQSGENSVAVSRRLNKKIPELLKLLPPDIKFHPFFDAADFIGATIRNLGNAILFGGIAVFFIILFFLKNFRASFIVMATIPTSLIITFLLMYLADYTINQISLSSLALAIGMVVDNAIVILDNIQRFFEKNIKAREAAIWGSAEMASAVIASTMTTIAIFLPIMFTGGIAAILFGQLAAIVTMALLASLLTALILTPMLCSRLLKPEAIVQENGSIIGWLEKKYRQSLTWVLANRITVLLILFWLFCSTFFIIRIVGTEFMPQQDQNHLEIDVELPTGTRFEKTGEMLEKISAVIKEKVPEVHATKVQWGVGEAGIATLIGRKESTNQGNVEIRLISKSKRKASPIDIIERLRPHLDKFPGVKIHYDRKDPLGNLMFGGGGDFTLEIYGHEINTALSYGDKIISALKKIEGLKDLEISQKLARPEIQIMVNREKASALGLNVSDIGKTVELYFSGDKTLKFRDRGDEYDIEVRYREKDRARIEDLEKVMIQTPAGFQVALKEIARLKEALGPSQIERRDQQRYIKITGDVYGRDPGSVIVEAEKILRMIPTPPGFTWQIAGAEEERREAFVLLILAGLLGMVLVYMVMASQFESLIEPFIIFLGIPFGFSGAVMALALSGNRISVVSLLGFIILIGIVVNNGIVLVSYINILIRREIPVNDAILQAAELRLRPILSTTLTTIFGMMPMVFSTGEGSEVWSPLALSVIGGLFVSSMVTLFLVPTLTSLFKTGFKQNTDEGS